MAGKLHPQMPHRGRSGPRDREFRRSAGFPVIAGGDPGRRLRTGDPAAGQVFGKDPGAGLAGPEAEIMFRKAFDKLCRGKYIITKVI